MHTLHKLTKIIATIGPASDTEELIEQLIRSGVNVFRFNFKHSTVAWHDERMKRVRQVAHRLGIPVGILLDLQGPEVRLTMPTDAITLVVGEKILLAKTLADIKDKGFTISHPDIIDTLPDGQEILADDGLFTFILKREEEKTLLVSQSEGILKTRKTINIPLLTFDFPVLHEKDIEGLMLAKENEVDIIALSFVHEAKDIHTLKEAMTKRSVKAQIMAKIETRKALHNIDEIIDTSDSIMIARGDLGVEIPAEEVPYYQKLIIKKCIEKGKPVDTATQMLESMTQRPKATRAEISDVANAVYDFTDCVMLSAESASGRYPLESVKVMAKTAQFIEQRHTISETRALFMYEIENHEHMICDAAFNVYRTLRKKKENIGGFLVFTQSGYTARMLSRYRAKVPIFAFSPKHATLRSLTVNFGVYPVLHKDIVEKDEIVKADIDAAFAILKEKRFAQSGQLFIVVHGDYWKSKAGTSVVRLLSVV